MDQHAAEQKRYDAKRERNIEKIVGAVKAVEEELSRGNNEEYPQQKRDRASERAGILGLWAAAIVGVIAIWIGNSDSGKQRKVMGGQLVTMQAAQRQTGETIAALTSQAKAIA
jgi:hypothetical protein